MSVSWSDRLAIGIPSVDRDHQGLVAVIAALETAMRAGRGADAVGATLAELEMYTRRHFLREQMLMKAAGYPRLADHVRLHTRFVADVSDLRARHGRGDRSVALDTITFLSRWLMDHIVDDDGAFAAWASANGKRVS